MRAHYKPIYSLESTLFDAVIQEDNKTFEYPWHYHPEYELTFILTGHGIRYVGNSMEDFYPNDFVLIGSNLPHCWINAAEQEETATAIVIYMRKEFLENVWMQAFEFESIRNLLELSRKGIKFDKDVALKFKDKLLQLLDLPPFEKFMFLLQILQELSQTQKSRILCEQGFTYDLNDTNNMRINVVYRYIQNNYRKKISLEDIAREVNMGEEYFSRYFSKIMKKSFFEYLNEYKINRACKLLFETDKSINEVCYMAGFESIPFFYRQFKKFKSCQPKAYR